MPLPDKPLITQMSDTHVTLTWKPGERSKLVEVPKTFNSIKQKKNPFTIKLLPSKTAIDNVLLFSFILEYVLKQFLKLTCFFSKIVTGRFVKKVKIKTLEARSGSG
jgi:hypothetical protein